MESEADLTFSFCSGAWSLLLLLLVCEAKSSNATGMQPTYPAATCTSRLRCPGATHRPIGGALDRTSPSTLVVGARESSRAPRTLRQSGERPRVGGAQLAQDWPSLRGLHVGGRRKLGNRLASGHSVAAFLPDPFSAMAGERCSRKPQFLSQQ